MESTGRSRWGRSNHTRAILAASMFTTLALLLYFTSFHSNFLKRARNGLLGRNAALYSAAQQQQQTSCLDVLVLYHSDDRKMFIDNGGFESYLKHLLGVRKFFVMSASDSDFRHLMGDRVYWIDEKVAPFGKADYKSSKGHGWLYQQALKLWAVAHLNVTCNDVMVVDSDSLWIRDFDVRVPIRQPYVPSRPSSTAAAVEAVGSGAEAYRLGLPFKYKYGLSSKESGAYPYDIKAYQHFTHWLLGTPKVWADTHTAICHWQVMQRDVLLTLEASLMSRGLGSLQDAVKTYGRIATNATPPSEYEAYFSFAWTHYRERMQPVFLPFVLRDSSKCNFSDTNMINIYATRTPIVYCTCHDNWHRADYYTNCKDQQCKPDTQAHKEALTNPAAL